MERSEIKVGQVLYNWDGDPLEVSKLGRKYFYVKKGYSTEKYEISTLREVSDYGSSQLYLTLEEVIKQRNESIYFSTLKRSFNNQYFNIFQLEQLKAAATALGITVEEFKPSK